MDEKTYEIEKQKLEIEKKRLDLEGQENFLKKIVLPLVSVVCAVIAGLFALAQVWVASIDKEKELELSKLGNERQWKLDIVRFVFNNRDVIFSDNYKEQRCLRDVILVTFPHEVTAKLFERIEIAVPVKQKEVWKEAQELVEKVVAVDEMKTEALKLFRQGKFSESVAVNDKALQFEPDNVTILNRKGYSLFRSKNFDKAITTLSKAVRLQPDHKFANLNLTKALCAAEKSEQAKNTLNAAINLKPDLLQTALSDGEFRRICKQLVPELTSREYGAD
ncbi:MAG: tetratricopeptide repeat protein [Candidatus Electrothrix sp. ATG2]|nr:tetratricopeptide repeat protein [Candidatus Electrothrix sp. ATG2]